MYIDICYKQDICNAIANGKVFIWDLEFDYTVYDWHDILQCQLFFIIVSETTVKEKIWMLNMIALFLENPNINFDEISKTYKSEIINHIEQDIKNYKKRFKFKMTKGVK